MILTAITIIGAIFAVINVILIFRNMKTYKQFSEVINGYYWFQASLSVPGRMYLTLEDRKSEPTVLYYRDDPDQRRFYWFDYKLQKEVPEPKYAIDLGVFLRTVKFWDDDNAPKITKHS